jgi:hypothetical protein
VIPRRELLETLWGTEVERRYRHRLIERLVHGRGWGGDRGQY